jgi:hypothetical protein
MLSQKELRKLETRIEAIEATLDLCGENDNDARENLQLELEKIISTLENETKKEDSMSFYKRKGDLLIINSADSVMSQPTQPQEWRRNFVASCLTEVEVGQDDNVIAIDFKRKIRQLSTEMEAEAEARIKQEIAERRAKKTKKTRKIKITASVDDNNIA